MVESIEVADGNCRSTFNRLAYINELERVSQANVHFHTNEVFEYINLIKSSSLCSIIVFICFIANICLSTINMYIFMSEPNTTKNRPKAKTRPKKICTLFFRSDKGVFICISLTLHLAFFNFYPQNVHLRKLQLTYFVSSRSLCLLRLKVRSVRYLSILILIFPISCFLFFLYRFWLLLGHLTTENQTEIFSRCE